VAYDERMTARVLAIIGSGETAPTMTSVHADLLRRAGGASARAVMLDTPFGFQENADDLAARTVAYFRDSVGSHIEVASFRDAQTATPLEYEQMCSRLAQADWVFAGPGSPSYAVRQWADTRVPGLLKEKLRSGGVVVFASAAAVGLGEVGLPVYEIYKVGEAVRWIPGLDLLRETGLRAAVIPHYSNAEGGTHDTRYCYMGERRLRLLEATLPEGCDILGVDEHTAAVIDIDARTLSVLGRGRVTWRRAGVERHWLAGDVIALDSIADDDNGGSREPSDRLAAEASGDAGEALQASPFMETVRDQREMAVRALDAHDPDAGVAAILAVETAVHDWSRDTLQSDEPDRAREVLRELMVRLAELAREGAADPRTRLAPIVDALLCLRESARRDGRFDEADRLRDALIAGGVAVHDTPAGSTWELEGAVASR
jgi:cyanophycinase-like exopeptidase